MLQINELIRDFQIQSIGRNFGFDQKVGRQRNEIGMSRGDSLPQIILSLVQDDEFTKMLNRNRSVIQPIEFEEN